MHKSHSAKGRSSWGKKAELRSWPPVWRVKPTPLFKSPEGYPNGIAAAPDGLWICEQKSDNAVLVDWKGKLLKTVKSQSKNTSGIAYRDGCVWMTANSSSAEGVF